MLSSEFELCVCLIDGDAGFETAGGEEEVSLIGAIGIELEGQPDVGGWIGLEVRAKDADDGIGVATEGDSGADYLWIAAELALPETITEDDDVATVGEVFLLGEGSTELDGSTEEFEVVVGDVDAVNLLGHGAGEVEAGTFLVVTGDVLKDAGLLLPYVEFGYGGASSVSAGLSDEELDQTFGLGVGEGFEEDGVDDGKDCRVDTDTECECGDCGEGEGGTFG